MKKIKLSLFSLIFCIFFSACLNGCQDSDSPEGVKPVVSSGGDGAISSCKDLGRLSLDGYEIDIVHTDYIDTPAAMATQQLVEKAKSRFTPFCRIEGYFEKRFGVNAKPYAIGFGIALPDNWNGRFLFQGGGGLNGLIREPVGQAAAGDIPALFRGFAVASTDSGHQSNTIFNTDFFEDPQALENFYSLAVAKTTRLSRRIIEHYYGDTIKHAYFVGCSTGGREAMQMSQHYPELFDGIIAGAPAMRTNYSEIADLWAAKQLQSIGSEPPFSRAQQTLIVEQLLQHCDAGDGLTDGLIMDVTSCDFDPAVLACDERSESESCLSATQVQALQQASAGPRLAGGDNVYPGFYYDTGIAARAEKGIPGLLQGVAGPMGKVRMDQPFDLQRELEIANSFPLAAGNTQGNKNLSGFLQAGGKLMFFHGVSDPWFSARDTWDYFRDMAFEYGGLERVASWSQFYFVPGMGHCHGGEKTLDRFDMLTALVRWVEQGNVPESITAWGDSLAGAAKPLCPFPKVARYKGKGDVTRADSFECR